MSRLTEKETNFSAALIDGGETVGDIKAKRQQKTRHMSTSFSICLFMILALIVLMAAIYALECVDAHVNKYPRLKSPNFFFYIF